MRRENEPVLHLVHLIQAVELAAAQVQPVVALAVRLPPCGQPGHVCPDHPIVRDEKAAWLHDEAQGSPGDMPEAPDSSPDRREYPVHRRDQWLAVLVEVAKRGQASTEIDIVKEDPLLARCRDHLSKAFEGALPGFHR